MPGPRVEGAVEVGDEVELREVELDLAEDVGVEQAPELRGA